MTRRALTAPVFLVLLFALAVSVRPARAEGAVRGHVTAPEGMKLEEVRIVLVPESARSGRLTVKVGKKGDFYFGIVPQGTWTLAVEGTELIPTSIKLVVHDTENRQDRLNYEGPPPAKQVFEVGVNLKVTYDLTLGKPAPPAAAATGGAVASGDDISALLQASDYTAALPKIDAALARSPEDPSLNYWRGFALFKLKKYDESIAAIKRTLELKSDQVGSHWVLGAIHSAQGKKAEAIAEFEKEIENPFSETPTRVNAYINIGLLHRDMGHHEASIAAFEKVIALDSKQGEAYSYLAEQYLAVGNTAKAEEVQAKGRAVGVEDPNTVFNVGATHWNNKEFAKAAEAFQRAVTLEPSFALAWKNLGYAQMNLGKRDEAVQAFAKYLELDPNAKDAAEVKAIVKELGAN